MKLSSSNIMSYSQSCTRTASNLSPNWQLHVPAAVRRSGKILTCFAGERKGKFSKNIASHCFNKSSCTVASYCLRECIETLANPEHYRPYYLKGRVTALQFDIGRILPAEWGVVLESNVSASMQTVVGTFGKGDMLAWRYPDRNLEVGKSRSFIELCMSGGRTRYLALADKFRPIKDLVYSEPPAGQPPVLVSIDFCLGNLSWVDFGDVIEILLPVGVRRYLGRRSATF